MGLIVVFEHHKLNEWNEEVSKNEKEIYEKGIEEENRGITTKCSIQCRYVYIYIESM